MYQLSDVVNSFVNVNCLTGLAEMPPESIDSIVTSPPYYGKRDYGTAQWVGGNADCDHIKHTGGYGSISSRNKGGREIQYSGVCENCGATRIDEQLGLEESPAQFIENLARVFELAYPVLKDTGTLWVNMGDTFANARYNYNSRSQTIGGGKSRNEPKDYRLPDLKKQGVKHTALLGIPWRLAFVLMDIGYMLRNEIIWHKPNPLPESVTSRCSVSHETIFLFVKSDSPKFFVHENRPYADCFHERKTRPPADYIWKDNLTGETYTTAPDDWQNILIPGGGKRYSRVNLWRGCNYYFDSEAIKEPLSPNSDVAYRQELRRGKQYDSKEPYRENTPASFDLEARNRRSVWTVPTRPYKGAHFATFPPELIEPMILAGSPPGGIVLDPFSGAGTTALVATENRRNYIGFELNPAYVKIAQERLKNVPVKLF